MMNKATGTNLLSENKQLEKKYFEPGARVIQLVNNYDKGSQFSCCPIISVSFHFNRCILLHISLITFS